MRVALGWLTNWVYPGLKGFPGLKIKTFPGKLWWPVTQFGFWKALSHMMWPSHFIDLSIWNSSSDILWLDLVLSDRLKNNALKFKMGPLESMRPKTSHLQWILSSLQVFIEVLNSVKISTLIMHVITDWFICFINLFPWFARGCVL